MKRFKKKEIAKLCKQAYEEGRKHQLEYDCPDIGIMWMKKWEDSKAYKKLKKNGYEKK